MTTNSKEYQKRYYEKNKEKIKASQRAYYKKQRELKKLNVSLFNSNFKEQVREEFKAIPQTELTYSQRYYAENRERIRAQQKEARRRKKINEKQRAYYAANREHICELQRRNRLTKKRKERLSKSFLGRICLKIFG